MTNQELNRSRLLDAIVEYIDIPKSYYDKAASRHQSLYEWLVRPDSTVVDFDPDVRPQGSFRYGTVIRPIFSEDEYDLDNVCLLRLLNKSKLTQEQLKLLYGDEIRSYANAHGMLTPVSEHNRCWRLHYADEASFHLDTLPCIPGEQLFIESLIERGVELDLARRGVAITDRKHQHYREICNDWYTSNPRGFAVWFESRAALGRNRMLQEKQLRASVEDVPPYEWKTTLQRSIQLLKRHRDVMFRKRRDLAPISMIITNLAAHAYSGEEDLFTAIRNIVSGMAGFISPLAPRVPNPTHPAEDYADKWSKDQRLEKCFWEWHATVSNDLDDLVQQLGTSELVEWVNNRFDVALSEGEKRTFGGGEKIRAAAVAAPVSITRASKPWGING